MSKYKGRCYYCKKDVMHSTNHDFGAFTKKWDKKSQRYILSDVFHMDCYVREMRRMMDIMTGKKPKEEYRQLSLFD